MSKASDFDNGDNECDHKLCEYAGSGDGDDDCDNDDRDHPGGIDEKSVIVCVE